MELLPTSIASGLGLAAILLFCLTNAKALPLAYTIRLLPSVYRLFLAPRRKRSPPPSTSTAISTTAAHHAAVPALFAYHTTTSRAILLDLDINMHKSNSTFFLDADVSRATLLTTLLAPTLHGSMFMLAGAQATFRREIRPWQQYVVSSRVLGWDEGALWVVTWWLRPGTRIAEVEEMCGWEVKRVLREEKGVLAVGTARYVVKRGRKTVVPVETLREAGLLVESGGKGEKGEKGEKAGLMDAEVVDKVVEGGLRYVKECMV